MNWIKHTCFWDWPGSGPDKKISFLAVAMSRVHPFTISTQAIKETHITAGSCWKTRLAVLRLSGGAQRPTAHLSQPCSFLDIFFYPCQRGAKIQAEIPPGSRSFFLAKIISEKIMKKTHQAPEYVCIQNIPSPWDWGKFFFWGITVDGEGVCRLECLVLALCTIL